MNCHQPFEIGPRFLLHEGRNAARSMFRHAAEPQDRTAFDLRRLGQTTQAAGVLDPVTNSAQENLSPGFKPGFRGELCKLGQQPTLVAIKKGVDLTGGKPMGNGHLQGASAWLDPKCDPRRPLMLANSQLHRPTGDIERSRLGRGWFPNGSAGFG